MTEPSPEALEVATGFARRWFEAPKEGVPAIKQLAQLLDAFAERAREDQAARLRSFESIAERILDALGLDRESSNEQVLAEISEAPQRAREEEREACAKHIDVSLVAAGHEFAAGIRARG